MPLTRESYDIALSESALGAAQPLLTAIRNPTLQTEIDRLGGYDLSNAGRIVPLTQ